VRLPVGFVGGKPSERTCCVRHIYQVGQWSHYCQRLSEFECIQETNGCVDRVPRFSLGDRLDNRGSKPLVQTTFHLSVRSLPWQGHRDQFSVYVHNSSTSEEDSQSTDEHGVFADRRIPSIEVCTSLVYTFRFSCPNLGRLPRTLLRSTVVSLSGNLNG
jgi:hypothetical protein